VDTLCALPGVGKLLVSTCTDVTRDQGVHSLRCNLGCRLPRAGDLGHLGVKDTLLVGVHLEGRQHIDLLNEKRWSILLPKFLSNSSEYPR